MKCRWSSEGGLATPALLATALLVASASGACSPGPGGANCTPECGSTSDCRSGRCRPKTLRELELDAPGRGLDVAALPDRRFLSAIHPSRHLVVAGPADESGDLRALAELGERTETGTAVGAREDPSVVAVAWRGGDDVYRIARRTEGEWRRGVRAVSSSDYSGSDDFDLALDATGGAHVLFRDADRGTLRHLAPAADQTWNLRTVDDGSTVSARTDCAPGGPELGVDPDAQFSADGLEVNLSVSYYDSVCGDLRLARLSEEDWTVRVVDTGNFSIPGGEGPLRRTGDVGRFSALATGPEGSTAIAYHDARRGGLAFATEDDGEFRTTLIDPGFEGGRKHFRGAFADLAFDRNGTPHVAYFDATTAGLRLASRRDDAEGWILRPVGRASPAGFHSRLVVGDDRLLLFAERLDKSDNGYRSRLLRATTELP